MARKYSNLASSRAEYARALPGVEGGFRGVDFSSSPHRVALYRLPDLQNMYRDYRSEEGGALESIPGFRRLHKLEGKIHGLYRYETAEGEAFIAAHAGMRVYLCRESERDGGEWVMAQGEVADNASRAFVYNNTLYLLDGKRYQKLRATEDGYALVGVVEDPYVPKTYYMGEQYEQRNMLTDRYTVSELGSGGVTPMIASNDQYDVNGHYMGRDTFVLSGKGDREAYEKSFLKVLVFANDEALGTTNSVVGDSYEHVPEEREQSVESVCLVAKSGNMHIEDVTPFYYAIKNLYINVDVKNGKKMRLDCAMDVRERVYFRSPQISWAEMFEFPENVLTKLPPNLVLRQGETKKTADAVGLDKNSMYEPPTPDHASESVVASTTLAENRYANKIYIHADGDYLALTAGVDVPVGRYYYAGNVIDAEQRFHYILYRIEVVAADTADEDMPVPVQDVYGYDAVPMVFHLPEKTKEVLSVKDEDFDAAFGCFYDDDGNITAVGAIVRAGENEVKIEALATDYHVKSLGKNATYLDANPDYKGTSEEAINGCTLCAIYDDRVFLAGNPALPNTVFYSARNDVGVSDPSYFGVLNYFNDGIGWEKITALFPFSDTLCVTKADTVYYHQGADGSDYVPRVYPSVRGNAGLGSLGACCNFLDDPVMLTEKGVFGINKETLTLERTLGRRSATVDARLLREENLGGAEMVEWEGYLCLFVNGHVYMADSRAVYEDVTGSMQYEWFYLADVGVWRDESGLSTLVYAAVTGELSRGGVSLDGETVEQNGVRYPLCETHEALTFTDVYSATVAGEEILYGIHGGKAYAVYPTGELAKEGVFHPALHPMVVGDRLYFGTDTGEIFVFNNDKRGICVGDDEVEPTEIHHSFYSFAGHRLDSGFLTRFDNCDIPHLCKSTSSRSLVLRVKVMSGATFSVGVSTEQKRDHLVGEVSAGHFTFGGMDFSALTFLVQSSATVVISERERRWVEKQYLLRDGGYCRPFGIYNMTYRYRIVGRIRE